MTPDMSDDEYEEARLGYMWYVSYTEDGREHPWDGRPRVNEPRSDYSRYWCTFQYRHGKKHGWISAQKTYNLEEMR